MRVCICTLVAFIAFSWGCASVSPLPGEQVFEEVLGYQYWIYLPEDYDANKPWPLVLFLHGRGSGKLPETILEHGPPKNISQGEHYPFILVSPRSPPGEWWSAPKLRRLLDVLVSRYPVDTKRIYLTGLSMGGFGTWALGAHAPEYFAALAPICGGGNPEVAMNYGDIPIRAYHGELDRVVKPEKSREMVDAVKRVGGNAELIIFPSAAHVSWPFVYDNPAFWTWLLAQERQIGIETDRLAIERIKLSEDVDWIVSPLTGAGAALDEINTSLIVENHLDSICQIYAVVELTPGIESRKYQLMGDVPPGSSNVWDLKLRASEPIPWSDKPVCSVTLEKRMRLENGESVVAKEQRIFPFAKHHFVDKRVDSVLIDGNLDEQSEEPFIFIESNQSRNGVAGHIFQMPDGLYLSFAVRDSTPYYNAELPVWEQDGLEIRLDLRPFKKQIVPCDDWDDIVPILISPGDRPGEEVVWKSEFLPEGIGYAATRVEAGYEVEVLIPAALLVNEEESMISGLRINLAQNDFGKGSNGEKRWYRPDWRGHKASPSDGVLIFSSDR